MREANELKLALVDLINILSEGDFVYHLTGGFASSYYGEPRFTQDIDIVIKISEGASLDRLINKFLKNFY